MVVSRSEVTSEREPRPSRSEHNPQQMGKKKQEGAFTQWDSSFVETGGKAHTGEKMVLLVAHKSVRIQSHK